MNEVEITVNVAIYINAAICHWHLKRFYDHYHLQEDEFKLNNCSQKQFFFRFEMFKRGSGAAETVMWFPRRCIVSIFTEKITAPLFVPVKHEKEQTLS